MPCSYFNRLLTRNAGPLNPGSTLVPSVGFGVPPKRTSQRRRRLHRSSLPSAHRAKSVPARRRHQHAGRARSPEHCSPRRGGTHVPWREARARHGANRPINASFITNQCCTSKLNSSVAVIGNCLRATWSRNAAMLTWASLGAAERMRRALRNE